MLNAISSFIADYGTLLAKGTFETVVMLLVPTVIAYVVGLFLGVVLYLTAPGGLRPAKTLNAVLGWVVNILRSFPFIVLMISVIPLTRILVGTGTGVAGTIPPLVLSAAPFIARMVEQSLAEIPHESVEAAETCGASTARIVVSALLPEALPSLVRGFAVVLIAVLGYTAIAGAVGAGGLGDIAIRYGYYRYQPDVMAVSIVILVLIVQLIQSGCDILARKVDHRASRDTSRKAGVRRVALAVAGVAVLAITVAGAVFSARSLVVDNKLVIAASPSPHAQILTEFAAPRLAKEGIKLEVREYTDYILPNQDTTSGAVDANYFQHLNYLADYNKKNGTDLVSVEKIHFEPMGVFAGTSKDLKQIATGAKISVPNDPTNEGRALLLLQDLGLITLDANAGITATKNDIVGNPHGIQIVEQEAAMLPATLSDVDFAVINGNYAIDAGLHVEDALAVEDAQSKVIQEQYANVICTTPEKKDDPQIKALVKVLTSPECRQYLEQTYGKDVLPAF